LVSELPIGVRLAPVVVEFVLGVVIGPFGLQLVEPVGFAARLSEFGLAALFFHAGLEIDFGAIRGRPLGLAATGWCLSVLLAAVVGTILHGAGITNGTWYVVVALTTTAIGTLLPILRDGGELTTRFGRNVLAAGAVGEFGPIVLLSVLLSRSGTIGGQPLLLIAFVVIAAAACAVALRARPPYLVALFARTLHTTSQLPVRVSLLLVGSLFVLAQDFGLEIVLGAFAGGLVVGLASRGPEAEVFHQKLDAVSFGFFIPIFFVMSGAQLDLGALLHANTLVRLPLFLALFLLVRGVPALLWRRELDRSDCLALALYSATALPIVVAITTIGTATGLLEPENAAALVGAGVVSVLVFPSTAIALRARRSTAKP
jgi:Kef-type K+ transport system membrane component KefB